MAASGCSRRSRDGTLSLMAPGALITGDPGIGKSAIVAQLIHANAGGQVLAHHCCQFRSRETLRPPVHPQRRGPDSQPGRRVAAQFDSPKVEAALAEGRCLDDPFSAFDEGILGPLHALHAPPGGTRFILIDVLDESLSLREGPSLVDLLASRLDRLPGWLRLVATARKDPDVLRGSVACSLRRSRPTTLATSTISSGS